MAYFGNQPLSASYLTDYFSGNNSTVAFTLSRAPVSASSVLVHISGVKQHASTYGVSGTTLTFSAAPPTGTNNIEVLHLGVQPDTVVQPSYRTITEFTATAGQTTFSPASYTAGYIDVYRNGVKLGSADFTATNGTTVVLANACAAGDYVRFEGFLITTFNNAIPNTNGAVGSSLIADGTVTDAKIYQVSANKLTGSRTLPNSVVPAGSILQVVQATNTTTYTTTTNTLSATSITASITPTSASSRILVMCAVSVYIEYTGSDYGCGLGIARNGSVILGDSSGYNNFYASQGTGNFRNRTPFNYVDSPATTSSTTYTVYLSAYNGRARVNTDNQQSTIILMEIAG